MTDPGVPEEWVVAFRNAYNDVVIRADGENWLTEGINAGLAAIITADDDAGYVRINLNDDTLLERIAEAIEVPATYARHAGETWDQWRQRAIRAALKVQSS
jgi:hypothetical protein